MTLVRWNPAGELASMEIDRLNRMFAELYADNVPRGWVPAVDIYETEQHEVVIKAEIPDMKREEIAITVENNVLTLKGQRGLPEEARPEGFRRRERQHGHFNRSFTLPSTVDAGRINASYKEGVLTIRLPQREDTKPRQIAVAE